MIEKKIFYIHGAFIIKLCGEININIAACITYSKYFIFIERKTTIKKSVYKK